MTDAKQTADPKAKQQTHLEKLLNANTVIYHSPEFARQEELKAELMKHGRTLCLYELLQAHGALDAKSDAVGIAGITVPLAGGLALNITSQENMTLSRGGQCLSGNTAFGGSDNFSDHAVEQHMRGVSDIAFEINRIRHMAAVGNIHERTEEDEEGEKTIASLRREDGYQRAQRGNAKTDRVPTAEELAAFGAQMGEAGYDATWTEIDRAGLWRAYIARDDRNKPADCLRCGSPDTTTDDRPGDVKCQACGYNTVEPLMAAE